MSFRRRNSGRMSEVGYFVRQFVWTRHPSEAEKLVRAHQNLVVCEAGHCGAKRAFRNA